MQPGEAPAYDIWKFFVLRGNCCNGHNCFMALLVWSLLPAAVVGGSPDHCRKVSRVLLFVLQFSVEEDLVPQMQACARHAFSAVLNKLNPMRRQHCFELFGLDFMVDSNHKVSKHLSKWHSVQRE